jgi:F-type H+-transporting ATPase subunit b
MFHLVKTAAESGSEHNVLLPASADVIWGGLSFLVIVVLFSKFVMPRMRVMTAERTAKIEGGLKQAEQSQEEAQALLAQYREALASANKEAADIRNAAVAERTAMIEEAKKAAAAAASAVTSNAQASLEADRARIAVELRRDLGTSAVELASRIVGESLKDDARATAVVDRFIAELEQVAGH